MKHFVLVLTLFISQFSLASTKMEEHELQKLLTPVRESFQKVLSQDKALAQSFEVYRKNSIAILQNKKLSTKEQIALIKLLNEKQRPALLLVMKKTGIDRREFAKKAEDVFEKLRRLLKRNYTWTMDDAMAVHWKIIEETEQKPAPPPPPESVTQIFIAPFQGRDFSVFGQARSVHLDERSFYSTLTQAIVAASTNEENGVTQFFTSLREYAKVSYTASVSNAEKSLMAEGFLGFGTASATSHLRLKRGANVVCERTFDHGRVIAAVAWISIDEEPASFDLNCAVRAVNAPADYAATLSTAAYATAAGGAAASAYMTINIRQLQLRFFND